MAKLYFHYGAMNAGKSTILLQAAYNYKERGMRTLMLKPSIDDREDKADHIASRIGLSEKAHLIDSEVELDSYIRFVHDKEPIDCVFVDEAQFLAPEQVWQLSRVADSLDVPVMCYGLRTDFKGNFFPGSGALLAIADSLKEIKTLCWCGRKATMTARIDKGGKADAFGEQVEIGGNERYISLCRRHWSQGNTGSET